MIISCPTGKTALQLISSQIHCSVHIHRRYSNSFRMAPRPQVGINPTMAVYSLVLGGACVAAAYTERYRRNQDDIDDRLKEKYATNMREQHEKIPQITNALRGQDMRVDGSMNQWVWGGKASLPTGGPTGRGYEARNHNTTATKILKENLDESSVSSSSSSTENTSDEEEIDESQLSNKERKRRRRERKKKRKEQREQEQRRLEAERQKLVVQSVAAGVAVGAVAVAASVFLGNGRK